MSLASEPRLQAIAQARQAVLAEGAAATDGLLERRPEAAWIERSWRRCLARGHRPDEPVAFDIVPAQAGRRAEEASHTLLEAARPVMSKLARAIAGSRYFAVLTDAQGIVVGVDGAIDRSDRRAQLITRIGVDLSEPAVGTTAIGAALAELQPVWLHRGEHFFEDTGCYSCAGAPLVGPDGATVGMLDLTGIDAAERPELRHLVAQSARSIENALAIARPHALLLRLGWIGHRLGDEQDGLLCLDDDGWVVGANPGARQMLAPLSDARARTHCSELFAMAWESLFDAVRRDETLDVPLWSGLALQVLPRAAGQLGTAQAATADGRLPLRDLETELIRQAVRDARGNVVAAARALGISRATVYRKLGRRTPK
ncbi:MAG TPA: helix-turn-helix domain-containing protein [Ramlibacter sp.]|jgi:transcriptional regulator of acetoin/glycerol metabolism|uniref:helix-turn-helix domain-containing protein n=1 Tax=Ramlibacter sp. TaxID=1917967 RepID=UPI002D645F5D|nr:helix-turn-helix domain-containing protein [Ramlibacter sp.]HZY20453.1 helix-turn-helix domain-containing protein [Ramlibacter sp.]